MEDVLLAIVIFGSIVWVIERVIHRLALNKERLKLIEKGGDLKELLADGPKREWLKGNDIKYGLVLIAAGLGTLLGGYMNNNAYTDTPVAAYFFGISTCVGIALVLSHYLKK